VFLFLNKVRALIFIKIEKELQPKIYTGLDMGTNPIRKGGRSPKLKTTSTTTGTNKQETRGPKEQTAPKS
jgi:hypothetical protein